MFQRRCGTQVHHVAQQEELSRKAAEKYLHNAEDQKKVEAKNLIAGAFSPISRMISVAITAGLER